MPMPIRRVAGAAQQPSAAAVLCGGGVVEEARPAADPGLRQGQLDPLGGLLVARDRCGDGADLLVAGHRQERRGAAVGLHADEVDVLLRVGQLVDAVRVDGAAGVLVGVDERGQSGGCLEALVEAEAELGQEGQVGAEAGEDDDLVDRVEAAAVLADEDRAAVGGALDGVGAEAGDRVGVALVDGGPGGEAEGAAGGELIGFAAAEGGAGDAPAQDPDALGAGAVVGPGEVGEVGERGEGGGAGADDRGAPARVPGADGRVLEIGHAIGDPVGRGLFTEGREVAAVPGQGWSRCPTSRSPGGRTAAPRGRRRG